jgi:hypothetical protein
VLKNDGYFERHNISSRRKFPHGGGVGVVSVVWYCEESAGCAGLFQKIFFGG